MTANNNNRLPFIFARVANADQIEHGATPEIKDWLVKIASHHDLKIYDARWMDDSDIGSYALIPDVDLCESSHIFPTFDAARQFVKAWWRDN